MSSVCPTTRSGTARSAICATTSTSSPHSSARTSSWPRRSTAWSLANGDSTGNFVWQAGQLSDGYPASPGGQLSFENDVLSILAAVPGGHGAGLFYWEPEWVPGVGWQPGAGTPNDNLTLYDFQGRALPSIGLFEDPVRV